MDTKLLGLGAAAVVGTMYISHTAVSWGMKKAGVTNEILKTWIQRITVVATGALAFYAVGKEYEKMLKNQKLISQLTYQLNEINQALLVKIQLASHEIGGIPEKLDMLKEKLDLLPFFEKMVEKIGIQRLKEILEEVGVLTRQVFFVGPNKIKKVTDELVLTQDYSNIPSLTAAFQKLGFIMSYMEGYDG